jgi:hypothetical protein
MQRAGRAAATTERLRALARKVRNNDNTAARHCARRTLIERAGPA